MTAIRRQRGRRRRSGATGSTASPTLPLAALLFVMADASRRPACMLSGSIGRRHARRHDRRGECGVGFAFRRSPHDPSSTFSSPLAASRTSVPREPRFASRFSTFSTFSPFSPSFAAAPSVARSSFRSNAPLRSTDGDAGDPDASTAIGAAGSAMIESAAIESATIESNPPPEGHAAAGASAGDDEESDRDDAYFVQLFDSLTERPRAGGDGDVAEGECVKLVDFIEENVGIRTPTSRGKKVIRGRSKMKGKNAATGAFSSEGKGDVIKVKGDITREVGEVDEGTISDDRDDGDGSDGGGGVSHQNRATSIDEVPVAGEIARRPARSKASTKSSAGQFDNIPVCSTAAIMEEQPPPSVREKKEAPYNVVCTHITADFDTLASAIGLAKLWSLGIYGGSVDGEDESSPSNGPLPTYVVLPRGAHPDVQRFLSLHKHLFPIRSLKSLPGFSDNDLKKRGRNGADDDGNPNEGLQRVGLVDAQRRDRLGPAEILLRHAKLGVTIVDHHVDAESDIQEARNYVVENVGSVSTMIAEQMRNEGVELTEAEATILALGIHSDTGSLVYDSTTPKDASMLAWAMEMGASQTAIAEHAKPTLSDEQQGVLTQALINVNSTTVHGVTIATVLLSADGFIPGLASVTKDALDLSSSDVFLLAVCYEATRGARGGGGGGKSNRKNGNNSKNAGGGTSSKDANKGLTHAKRKTVKALSSRGTSDPRANDVPQLLPGVGGGLSAGLDMINSESWKGGEVAFKRQRLAATFAFYDTDRSGFLGKDEVFDALNGAGFVVSKENFDSLIELIDINSDGKISFEEFVYFYTDMEEQRKWDALRVEIEGNLPNIPSTMTIIGRVKAGINVRNVNLNTLFQQFNGGGHPKAASATAKLDDESEAKKVLQELVDELIKEGLDQQLTVGDFMQSPVLSAKPTMTEKQVEDLFVRYDVRALPVVDDDNQVIGLVSYREVSAAKMRLTNKQEKRMRQIEKAAAQGKPLPESRPLESALKGWMKQHVQTVEASLTMAEVENVLLETDVGCIPVVADNTNQLIGMVTRTDLLRQHRYYSSLHYHNKGFSDSIAARKPIIELRKRLKKFDIENE